MPQLYKFPAKKIALLTSTKARDIILLGLVRLDDLALLNADQLEALLQDEFISYFKEKRATYIKDVIEPGVPDPAQYSANYIFLSIATALVKEKTDIYLDFEKLNTFSIDKLKRLVSPRGLQLLKKKHDQLKLVECTDEEFENLIPKAELAARHYFGKLPQDENPFQQLPIEIIELVLRIPVESINRLRKAKFPLAVLATVSFDKAKLLLSEGAIGAYEAGFKPSGLQDLTNLEIARTMAKAVLNKKPFIFRDGFYALDECDDIGKLKCLCRYRYFDLLLAPKVSLSELLKLPKSTLKLFGKVPKSKSFVINGYFKFEELQHINPFVLSYIAYNSNVEIFLNEWHCTSKHLVHVKPECLELLFSQKALDALQKKYLKFEDLVKLDVQRLTILLSSNAITTYENNGSPPVDPLSMTLKDLWEFLSLIPDTLAFVTTAQNTATSPIVTISSGVTYSAISQHQGQHK